MFRSILNPTLFYVFLKNHKLIFFSFQVFLDHRPKDEVSKLVTARTNGATPLVLSCRNGHHEVVQYLVDRYLNIPFNFLILRFFCLRMGFKERFEGSEGYLILYLHYHTFFLGDFSFSWIKKESM